jgi:hypothetical protein
VENKSARNAGTPTDNGVEQTNKSNNSKGKKAFGFVVAWKNRRYRTFPQWKERIQRSILAQQYHRHLLRLTRRQIAVALLLVLVVLGAVVALLPEKKKKKYHHFKPFLPDSADPLSTSSSDGTPSVLYGCGNSTRQVDEIQIHVIGWKRNLEPLLQELQNADYSGWTGTVQNKEIPFYLHVDGGGGAEGEETMRQARNFVWEHGPQHIDIKENNVGLRSMWLDSLGAAARKAGDNSLLVTFEDDMRVSSGYFQWLLAVIDAYGRNPDCRDSNLVGFSLSPILFQEMKKPFKKWDARSMLQERYSNDNRHIAYLSAVPSSWGAAYWSNQWNQFDQFVRLRMQPAFYDTAAELVKGKKYDDLRLTPDEFLIPDARSNVWPKSWKRFMVDFMYVRGLVMLYPCLPGQKGLATALQQDGEHISLNAHVLSQRDPRTADLVDTLRLRELGNLPRYGDLAVFDLFLERATINDLALEGADFIRRLYIRCSGCEELVRAWARPGTRYRESKASRRICLPDHYTPVSAMPAEPNPSIRERYLLFEPQYGANNQLHAIIEAFYWAIALERRLVIPPIFMPRVSALPRPPQTEWLEFEKYLSISEIQPSFLSTVKSIYQWDPASLQPIGFAEFAKKKGLKKPWRLIRLTHQAIFDASARVLTSALPGAEPIVIDLRQDFDSPVSIKTMQHLLGGCDDEVLAFDGMFFANLKGLKPRDLMPDVMKFSEESLDAFTSIKAKFETEIGSTRYGCYHVRLGDFTEMCDALQHPENHPDVSRSISTSYLRTAQEFACSVPQEQLVATLRAKGYPAFIMSDNAAQLREVLSGLGLKYLTSEWVAQAVRDHFQHRTISDSEMQLYSLLMDQELCSQAEVAVLNRFSTVSQRVVGLRRFRHFEFWMRKKQFI